MLDVKCSAEACDVGVAGLRGAHLTFTGFICDMPVALGCGRRPVVNGHLVRALTLAADDHLDTSI